jgi:hypothetical protein
MSVPILDLNSFLVSTRSPCSNRSSGTALALGGGPGTGLIVTGDARLCLAGRTKLGGGRVPDRVEVGCYAGGRGDETPRMVLLGGREVTVQVVERRWIEEPVGSTGGERRRMFQVRLEDGRRCRLAQEPGGSWTLAHTASGR